MQHLKPSMVLTTLNSTVFSMMLNFWDYKKPKQPNKGIIKGICELNEKGRQIFYTFLCA